MAGLALYAAAFFAANLLALMVSLPIFAYWKGPSGRLSGTVPLSTTELRVMFVMLFVTLSVVFNGVLVSMVYFFL